MNPVLSLTQVQERLTVTVQCVNQVSESVVSIVIDGKAYSGLFIVPSIFAYTLALERGPHIIYAQATDSAGAVTIEPITYVMSYELTEYGIDVYSGDAKLDVIEPLLHDALLPDLPTLNFSCATLLTGTIGAVIRERGLRQYQFTIATVGASNGLYRYTCKAAESYALTTALMTLQTAYGATSDAIRLLVPSLNIVNVQAMTHSTVNLVANGGFEKDIAGWSASDATLSRETGVPLVGTGSLKFLVTTSGNAEEYSLITTIVGHTYQATCLAKSTAAAGRLSQMQAAFGEFSGLPVDCSTEATLTIIFTATFPTTYLVLSLVNGQADEYLIIDSVVCYDLTPVSNVDLLARQTNPQIFANITPVDVIGQLMIQALAQASVRNSNLYVFPLDVSGQLLDYHMQRLDPLTGWQRDADLYNAVVAHYLVKQYPSPDTALTLNDALIAGHWTSTGTPTAPLTTSPANVTQTLDNLLPVPSGALGMLYANGNASRVSLSAAFKDFDRIRFNWLPVTAAYVDISLQQDGANKLDLRHYWAGQSGAGFVQHGSPGVSTDTVTQNISMDDTGSGGTATKFVTTVTGTTTAGCSYRVTLLDAASAVTWQDVWSYTIGSDNTFSAHVPETVSRVYQATTVRIEFTSLYLIGADYGVQGITCTITAQTWTNVGSHQKLDSVIRYEVPLQLNNFNSGNYTMPTIICPVPTLVGNQTYEVYGINAWITWINSYTYIFGQLDLGGSITASEGNLTWYVPYGPIAQIAILNTNTIIASVFISETVQDWAWVSSTFVWSPAFNLFESVDLPLSGFTRTGNPMNLATIALTFSGDNYVDSLVLVADNPLPVTVRAGTGSRPYVVTDDFGSEAGAQAYADGLLPIVSVAREQYTRDVSLATDLGVGDTISGDGVNMTVYAVDYRQDGKTLAAGRSMDTLMTRLAEQARRLGTLERKGA